MAHTVDVTRWDRAVRANACPTCFAAQGKPCDIPPGHVLRRHHVIRITLARKAWRPLRIVK